MWTKKGLLGRSQAKGEGGHGLEAVIEFGQTGVIIGGWTLKAVGALDLGWYLSASGGNCVPRALQSIYLGIEAEGSPVLFRVIG